MILLYNQYYQFIDAIYWVAIVTQQSLREVIL